MRQKHLAALPALETHGFDFLGFNQYIHTGYRVHHTWTDCVLSLFEFHNETLNVWTHLVGAILFLGLCGLSAMTAWSPPSVLKPHFHPFHLEHGLFTPTTYDHSPRLQVPPSEVFLSHGQHVSQWPIVVYASGVAICFACSAIYHLMYIQSRAWCDWFSQVDYAGIIVLIASAFVPFLYYSFYCNPTIQAIYLSIVAILAVASLVASFAPSFQAHPNIRTGVFLCLAGFGLVPLVHLIRAHGIRDANVQMTLRALGHTSVFNFMGIFFYVTRFPESRFPGRFDVVGASHQLWHLCVLAASLVHYTNAVEHFELRCMMPCN
ncbi:hypothetical protein LEN26_016163 [Aphanomyces euteiches]|nr:hypothetical protein LEN26_016163 [Aphanomyces euteiches]KAH9113341.1 hypothetical protein AeMF1_012449 [Aphanomyces euteiches]KAH9188804.1 hypothetical protein AeNC1_009212 [Aphanomyces euteiches]